MRPILSESLSRFVEAIVHPFGNSSIGATIPDHYQELVVPTTDRIELDVHPSDFYTASPPPENSGYTLVGIFLWFQPRCLASGIIGANTVEQDLAVAQYPYFAVGTDLSTILNSNIILDQYVLCAAGLWNTPTGKGYGTYDSEGPGISNYFTIIEYDRFNNIDQNCNKLRICGAGLKVWAEEAPINTGGYSVAGWATIDDILQNFRWHGVALPPESEEKTSDRYPSSMRKQPKYEPAPGDTWVAEAVNPAAIHSFQTHIKFACRSPGVKGATVRYSPLQTAAQMQSQFPSIPESQYSMSGKRDGKQLSPPMSLPDVVSNDELAVHDVITPGSYVPCIMWNFNTNAQSNITEQYTLKVMSVVHSEGVPTGSSPFMATKSMKDPGMDYLKTMVENLEAFPAATTGHSFKSFFTKTRHVMNKIGRTAGHISRLISFADQFASAFG
jgi:hypothetical protein